MQAALRQLGYHETYHFFSLYSNIRDCEMWQAAFEAKYSPPGSRKAFGRAEWDQLLGHCAAVCDVPAICFAPELIAAYPEAKVVLVGRDLGQWYRSFNDVVISNSFAPGSKLFAQLDRRFLGPISLLSYRFLTCFFRSRSRAELRANAKKVYLEHYELVRRLTPPGRLLELELGAGWEPLCRFLGKEVPSTPFPRGNETAVMKEKLRIVMRRAVLSVVLNGAVLGAGMAFLMVVVWYLLEGLMSKWKSARA